MKLICGVCVCDWNFDQIHALSRIIETENCEATLMREFVTARTSVHSLTILIASSNIARQIYSFVKFISLKIIRRNEKQSIYNEYRMLSPHKVLCGKAKAMKYKLETQSCVHDANRTEYYNRETEPEHVVSWLLLSYEKKKTHEHTSLQNSLNVLNDASKC